MTLLQSLNAELRVQVRLLVEPMLVQEYLSCSPSIRCWEPSSRLNWLRLELNLLQALGL